jgi:hypothetical protein
MERGVPYLFLIEHERRQLKSIDQNDLFEKLCRTAHLVNPVSER